MARRGFGIAAATLSSLVAPLAAASEANGYDTFWVNDTPGSDGFDALRRAAEVTSTIRLGVGVIPIDRRPPDTIVQAIEEHELPKDRLIVGVGVHFGAGCPSGHGVCGIARLSRRSIAATCVFMASTAATVFVIRHVLGGFA